MTETEGNALAPARNAVVVIADDFAINYMGGGDETYGVSRFSTPFFTTFRRESASATNILAAGNNCGKARVAMTLGQMAEMIGMASNFDGARSYRNSVHGIPADAWTIGKAMQSADIRFGHFGKCHRFGNASGLDLAGAAAIMGADHHYMFAGPGGEQHPDLKAMRDADLTPDRRVYYGKIDDMIFDAARKFISERVMNGERFFANIECRLVHTPHGIPEGYDLSNVNHHKGAYLIMAVQIERLMNHFKRLYLHLRDLGVLDDTLVIFTSDQGGIDPDNPTVADMVVEGNYRMPGKKPSATRGNFAVPFFARKPGLIPANSTVHTPFTGADLPVTICEALGVPVPAGLAGESALAAWQGDTAWRRQGRYFWLNAEGEAEMMSPADKGRDMAMYVPETDAHEPLLVSCNEDATDPRIYSVFDYEQDDDLFHRLNPIQSSGYVADLCAWRQGLIDGGLILPEAA